MRTYSKLVLAAMVALSLAACGTSTEQKADSDTAVEVTQESEEASVDGGWTVNDEVTGSTLAPEQAEVFEKAMSEVDGVDYEPICVVGEQVVSGMNYAYLCKAKVVSPDAKPSWDIVVIYQDLEGNALFSTANEIDPSNVAILTKATGAVTGGWETPMPTDAASLPGDADAAFEAAMAQMSADGGDYELVPQALLATQVVAGTNYQVICVGRTTESPDAAYQLYDVTIYQDLDGKVEISSIETMDLTAYVTLSDTE